MASRLKTIVRYLVPEEAEIARLALEDEGIAVYVEGKTTAGMLWHLDNAVGGAKLQVAEEDAERALAILAQKLPTQSDDDLKECLCKQCGVELPPGFNICWSCGAAMDGCEPIESSAQASPDEPLDSQPMDDNQTAAEDEADDATAAGDAMAWRALAAAVIGIVFLPGILHVYSIWILLKLGYLNYPLSRKGKWYYGGAVCFDIAMSAIIGVFLTRW